MRLLGLPIGVLAAAYAGLLGAQGAHAGWDHTWVSFNGTDNPGCGLSGPCRTLQNAHTNTNAGGIITILTSGSYAALTITKSISVVADDGVDASILSITPGPSLTVNAPAGTVILRGLTIAPPSGAHAGISFLAGTALNVVDCFIRKTSIGISFAPTTGASELYVSDTTIANDFSIGLLVRPTGTGSARVVLERVDVENAANIGMQFSGFLTTGSITATVTDSISAGNSGSGIRADDAGAGTTKVVVDHSVSSNNSVGIYTNGLGSTIWIGDSTVSGNTVKGLLPAASGVITSYGSNKVNGNVSDGIPTNTILNN
jgi:hypothetical protein